MPTLKDCPNCGSFDITIVDTDHDLSWFRCRSCGDEWVEECSGVGFDRADEDLEFSREE